MITPRLHGPYQGSLANNVSPNHLTLPTSGILTRSQCGVTQVSTLVYSRGGDSRESSAVFSVVGDLWMDVALDLVVCAESIFVVAHAVVGGRHGWSDVSEGVCVCVCVCVCYYFTSGGARAQDTCPREAQEGKGRRGV
jgi:hypothetical protein